MINIRAFPHLLKKELISYFLNPAFYIAAVLCNISSSLSFFVLGQFFVLQKGSSDLRFFFSYFPYISIIILPILTMHLYTEETGGSSFRKNNSSVPVVLFLPIASSVIVLAKWVASIIVFILIILFTVVVPIIVSFFGNVEIGQVITSYSGILLFAGALLAIGQLFALVIPTQTGAFILCAIVLAIFNSIHLIPVYVSLPSWISSIFKFFSFAWHFDAAGKGIIDTRDIVFYFSVIFVALSICSYLLDGKKSNRLSLILKTCVAILLIINSSRFFSRIDITDSKKFTVSDTSVQVLQQINEPLRITYYLSPKLKDLYPQVRDVSDFLSSYAAVDEKIVYSVVDPVANTLEKELSVLGVESQQIESSTEGQTSYITVYSAIILEYTNKTEVIPFILSTGALEFELTKRVQYLLDGIAHKAVIVCANNLSIDSDYTYLIPWLESAGFSCSSYTISENTSVESFIDNIDLRTPIILLGSSKMKASDVESLESFIMKGGRCLFFISRNIANYTSDWAVTPAAEQGRDYVFPLLDAWGVTARTELVLDKSCYRIRMQSSATGTLYDYVDYPLWVEALPKNASMNHAICASFTGAQFYWCTPLTLSGDSVYPLLQTSNEAWLMKSDKQNSSFYVTDPYLIQDISQDNTIGQYIVGAYIEGSLPGWYTTGKSVDTRLLVFGDQYFASNTIEYTNGTGNLDTVVNSLLWLTGDDDILEVKRRGYADTSLSTLPTGKVLKATKIKTYTVVFIFIPLTILITGGVVLIIRRMKTEKKDKRLQK